MDENQTFKPTDTLHDKEAQRYRIEMAEIIADHLDRMKSPNEATTVVSLVIAELLDRRLVDAPDADKEQTARAIMLEISNAALHVWGAANEIDIPIDGSPPPFPEGTVA